MSRIRRRCASPPPSSRTREGYLARKRHRAFREPRRETRVKVFPLRSEAEQFPSYWAREARRGARKRLCRFRAKREHLNTFFETPAQRPRPESCLGFCVPYSRLSYPTSPASLPRRAKMYLSTIEWSMSAVERTEGLCPLSSELGTNGTAKARFVIELSHFQAKFLKPY